MSEQGARRSNSAVAAAKSKMGSLSRRDLLKAGTAAGLAAPALLAMGTGPAEGAGAELRYPKTACPIPTGLPDYITGLGDSPLPQYHFQGLRTVQLHVYVQAAELQDICNRYLNDPLPGGAGRFQVIPYESTPDEPPNCLTPVPEDAQAKLHIVFSSFPESTADFPTMGTVGYTEVAFYFGVRDTTDCSHYLFLPAMFLDGPAGNLKEHLPAGAIGAGREIMGLPKVRGQIRFPGPGAWSEANACCGCLYPPSGGSVEPNIGNFLNIRKTGSDVLNCADTTCGTSTFEFVAAERRPLHAFEVALLLWGPWEKDVQLGIVAARDGIDFPEDVLKALRLASYRPGDPPGTGGESWVDRAPGDENYLFYLETVENYPDESAAILAALDLELIAGGEPTYYNGFLRTTKSASFAWLGLRQLRHPLDFSKADVQNLVTSVFKVTLDETDTYDFATSHVVEFGALGDLVADDLPGSTLAQLIYSMLNSGITTPMPISGFPLTLPGYDIMLIWTADAVYPLLADTNGDGIGDVPDIRIIS